MMMNAPGLPHGAGWGRFPKKTNKNRRGGPNLPSPYDAIINHLRTPSCCLLCFKRSPKTRQVHSLGFSRGQNFTISLERVEVACKGGIDFNPMRPVLARRVKKVHTCRESRHCSSHAICYPPPYHHNPSIIQVPKDGPINAKNKEMDSPPLGLSCLHTSSSPAAHHQGGTTAAAAARGNDMEPCHA